MRGDNTNYYVVACCCKNKTYLSETYIVKAIDENSAINIVMEQRINEINTLHQQANKGYEDLGNDDILFPIFARDDLTIFSLDEYMQKYSKNNTLDIGGD